MPYVKALNFVNNLKAERSGKAVVTDVIDEGSSGLDDQVNELITATQRRSSILV